MKLRRVMVGAVLIAGFGGCLPSEGTVVDARDDATDSDPTDVATNDVEVNAIDTALECDGRWETGCRNGESVQLCCPTGTECNYGWSVPCNGACIDISATCPEPCDGAWETRCDDGLLEPVCCPAGIFCNYYMTYTPCGGDTCVPVEEECPQ